MTGGDVTEEGGTDSQHRVLFRLLATLTWWLRQRKEKTSLPYLNGNIPRMRIC